MKIPAAAPSAFAALSYERSGKSAVELRIADYLCRMFAVLDYHLTLRMGELPSSPCLQTCASLRDILSDAIAFLPAGKATRIIQSFVANSNVLLAAMDALVASEERDKMTFVNLLTFLGIDLKHASADILHDPQEIADGGIQAARALTITGDARVKLFDAFDALLEQVKLRCPS